MKATLALSDDSDCSELIAKANDYAVARVPESLAGAAYPAGTQSPTQLARSGGTGRGVSLIDQRSITGHP